MANRENDFREAYVDEQGTLTDYYLLQGSDTVNMIDVGAANYDLNISFELQIAITSLLLLIHNIIATPRGISEKQQYA